MSAAKPATSRPIPRDMTVTAMVTVAAVAVVIVMDVNLGAAAQRADILHVAEVAAGVAVAMVTERPITLSMLLPRVGKLLMLRSCRMGIGIRSPSLVASMISWLTSRIISLTIGILTLGSLLWSPWSGASCI
jgi:hypothetical protein